MHSERRCIGEPDFEFSGRWVRLDVVWDYCEYDTWEDHVICCRHRWDWRKGLIYRCPLETWFFLDDDERMVELMSFVRRSEHAELAPQARAIGLDPVWAKKYPALWDHLTLGCYEDGSARTLSTLSWFLGLEGLTVCLQDRDNSRSLFASGDSWARALEILDKQAQRGDEAPWRRDKREFGNNGRTKK